MSDFADIHCLNTVADPDDPRRRARDGEVLVLDADARLGAVLSRRLARET